MTHNDVKNTIIRVLQKEILLREISNIEDEALLGDQGFGLDSILFLKFLTILEKELDIKIDDVYWDYERLSTIGKIIEYYNMRKV